MVTFKFLNKQEAWKFVLWTVEQDDIPYITTLNGDSADVIMFPIEMVYENQPELIDDSLGETKNE